HARRWTLRPAPRRLERRHRNGAVSCREPARVRGLRWPRSGRALSPLAARGVSVLHRAVPRDHRRHGPRAGACAMAPAAVLRLARPRGARSGSPVARRAGGDVLLRAARGCRRVGRGGGPHYTASAIPTLWRNSLIKKQLIESCADRLLAHAMLQSGG